MPKLSHPKSQPPLITYQRQERVVDPTLQGEVHESCPAQSTDVQLYIILCLVGRVLYVITKGSLLILNRYATSILNIPPHTQE